MSQCPGKLSPMMPRLGMGDVFALRGHRVLCAHCGEVGLVDVLTQ
jgi:hypothetical protein